MSHRTTGRSERRRNPVLESLTDRRRRYLVTVLLDRRSPVRERELAIHLAAASRERSVIDLTDADVRAERVALAHVHLPALEDAELVDWNRDEATVTATEHPALQDPRFERLVETEAAEWDAVVETLADERRRSVLAVLADRDGPASRSELVERIRVPEGAGETGPDAATIRAALHHVDLPKLAAAGLVAYDADAGTVAYEGHPDLPEEWLESGPGERPRSVLTSARLSPDIWTIEGRHDVLEHGRSLLDQAENELFLLFTTDGLLEPECFIAIEGAVDRSVDVYLGTQTQEVRDRVRERCPAVTLWEPQLDWMNLPPRREKLGRLVFADREAIMLATLGEKSDGGVHAETALAGAGEDNALVVLMREMLGSRLDHLDAQSEDFRSQLPL